MSKLHCIIVEDEPLAVKVLADYIAAVPFLELAATLPDALAATDYLHRHPVDLMFLDIHLPRLKGLDFLRLLDQKPAVVVTTAYHQYAVDGYELDISDYLLKPIRFERFLKAVNKVHAAAKERAIPAAAVPMPVVPARDALFIMEQKRKVRIQLADILYIESQREYVRIVTAKGEHRTKMGTQEFLALLPEAAFLRIHRSFVVAIARVEAYTAEVVEILGKELPVGREYRGELAKLEG
jgi:two-component system, LytTR family, response regulator